MSFNNAAVAHLAPFKPQRLSGTDQAESESAVLDGGRFATLLVGSLPVRVRFLGETGGTNVVATTDLLLAANTRYDWLVEPRRTDVVYIEGDGAGVYEAWVWTSSPKA